MQNTHVYMHLCDALQRDDADTSARMKEALACAEATLAKLLAQIEEDARKDDRLQQFVNANAYDCGCVAYPLQLRCSRHRKRN